ncbi:MAG TPA: cytochrome c peroxidase [Kofleriaceae bacterium]|nr:cytochrome c peroxidase [Kofleriaceae bacterium]
MIRGAIVLVVAAAAACSGKKADGDQPDKAKAAPAEPPVEHVPRERSVKEELPPAPPVPDPPRGLPPTPSPDHNPTTPEKVELGRLLFFEPRLSESGGMSCASCHQPEHGFSSPDKRSAIAGGRLNLRHTPTLYNTAYNQTWAWDGNMPVLEAMVLSHWKGQLGAAPEAVAAELPRAPGYAGRFARAFDGDPASRDHVTEALAAFVRTIRSGDSPWDRHEAGEAGAVSADALAGFRIFTERAGCATCHPPPLYSDGQFHPRGVGDESDPGRARVTADSRHSGAFKTPGLRSLVDTAPYFHDGSAATLEAAVDHELARSERPLSPDERRQLVEFLKALSPAPVPMVRPELPVVP